MTACLAADADATRACGARLAQALLDSNLAASPILVTLAGELGAGKTTFVAGFLAALGHEGPVRSPTYTLIEPYRLQGRDIQHCDLYRLRHPDELDDLGWRDLCVPGTLLLVEWPDRGGDRLGAADLAIQFDYAAPDSRRICWEARSATGQALAELLSR